MNDEEMVGYNIDQDLTLKPHIDKEKIDQLVIYIRNYDADGHIVDSPVDAVKTCIDTYERSLDKYTWTEKPIKYRDDGSTYYDEIQKESTQISVDNTLFIDEELKKVEPIIIDAQIFFTHFLHTYFDYYNINKNKGGKTIYIEFHNTSDLYTHYNLTIDDIIYLKNKNFDIIGLNLDNNNLILDTYTMIDLAILSIQNAHIIMNTRDSDITIKAQSVFFDVVTIESENRDSLHTITLNVSQYAKLQYISFTKDICKFKIINTDIVDMQKWMQTKVDVYSISFGTNQDTDFKSYKYKTETLFSFEGIYTISLNSINLVFDILDMNIIKCVNSMYVSLGSFYLLAQRINRTPISLDSVTNCTACGLTATQKDPEANRIYLIFSSKGGTFGEHKFVSLITTHIGLFACAGERVSKISFTNSRCIAFSEPIRYLSSTVEKMIFSSCNFDKITQFKVHIGNLSVFNSNFSNINLLKLLIGKKMYITNSSFNGTTFELSYLDEGSSLIEDSKIKFKTISISGNEGSGEYKQIKSRMIADTVDATSLVKFSTNESELEVESFNLIGTKINSFNPLFVKNKLKNLSITGVISNSLILIDHERVKELNMTFKSIKGELHILCLKEIGDINMTIDTAILKMTLDISNALKNKIKANLKCLNDCKQSVITSYTNDIEFAPVAEGSFKDMELYSKDDDLTKPQWKEKIAYGYEIKE